VAGFIREILIATLFRVADGPPLDIHILPVSVLNPVVDSCAVHDESVSAVYVPSLDLRSFVVASQNPAKLIFSPKRISLAGIRR
jgi:hypothetical protein